MKVRLYKYIVSLFFIMHSGLLAANNTMPQLDFTKYPQQIFWLIVTFALTYAFISKVVFPKIVNIKQVRQTKILTNIEQTIKLKKDISSINDKILSHMLKTDNTINQLNCDLNEKIALLKDKHAKNLDEYKKQSNTKYLKDKENYLNTNDLINFNNLELICNLITQKLDLQIDSAVLKQNIQGVSNK